MKIRRFQEPDAPAVRAVVTQALQETNTKDYPPRLIKKMKAYFTDAFFVQKHQEDTLVVAEQEGAILATARLDKNLITNMFVAPNAQGRGIGKALTEHLEAEAKKRGYMFVRIYASLSAIKFYEQLGYQQVDVSIHDVFGTNAVMQKSFAQATN